MSQAATSRSEPSLSRASRRVRPIADRFVPPPLLAGEQGADALRRARLTVTAALAALGSFLFGIVYSLFTGLTLPAVVMGLALPLLLAAPMVLRATGSVRLAANLVCAALFGAVLTISIADRGVETPLLVATSPVCLIAALLAGRRWTVFWGALSLLAIWSLYAAHLAGVEFRPMLPPAGQTLNAAVVLTALIGVVSAIAYFYETYKTQAIEELAELTRRLEAERRRAERASASKSHFLAQVSHEIRTPMNGILTMAELLAATDLDPDKREFADTIRQSSKTLLKLLDEILDLRRCEVAALQLESTPFRPAMVVHEAASALRAQAQQKGLDFTLRFTGDEQLWLRGDPARLRQVLLNLIANAIKFTSEGGVEVHTEIEAVGEERGRLRIAVRDTGIGIPPERLPHVFEVFEQVDASTSRRFGGSGLGLAICRQLVERMGGRIEVESTPGEGSVFRIELTLPRAEPQPAARPSPAAETTTAAEPAQPLSGRVLLAEDNPVNRRVATLLLQRLGLEVDVAEDGHEALARTADTRYDLVLMDCQMPGLDGYEATRRIRAREGDASPSAQRLAIVALTASAMESDRERCLEAGMDDYLSKPIDPAELRRVLERYLTPEPRDGRPGARPTEPIFEAREASAQPTGS